MLPPKAEQSQCGLSSRGLDAVFVDREDEAATFEEIDMKNAHERFGALEFVKRTKDTTTRVRVHIDRAVLENSKR